jgi:hypothetical protein
MFLSVLSLKRRTEHAEIRIARLSLRNRILTRSGTHSVASELIVSWRRQTRPTETIQRNGQKRSACNFKEGFSK